MSGAVARQPGDPDPEDWHEGFDEDDAPMAYFLCPECGHVVEGASCEGALLCAKEGFHRDRRLVPMVEVFGRPTAALEADGVGIPYFKEIDAES